MKDHQAPILRVHQGGQSTDAIAWDAHFELSLASFISRYLADDPPPPDVALAADAREWARNLARDGRARQEEMQLPLLRATPA